MSTCGERATSGEMMSASTSGPTMGMTAGATAVGPRVGSTVRLLIQRSTEDLAESARPRSPVYYKPNVRLQTLQVSRRLRPSVASNKDGLSEHLRLTPRG